MSYFNKVRRESGLTSCCVAQISVFFGGTAAEQELTLGMCAILPDKYQWLAPGFRLLLTGSHCLSGFTQMETILSQHSHKNQSGALLVFCFFSFPPPTPLPPSPLLSSPFGWLPLYCGETVVGLFSFYWCGDNTFICLQDLFSFLRAHPTHHHHHHQPRLHISQRSVSSHRREREALNASVQTIINAERRFSLSSVSCLRLRWRGSTSFQLWLLPVIGLLVSVMRARCVAPSALQDDFPNHYAVLCRPPAGSLAAAGPPVNGLRVCVFHLSCFPNSYSEQNVWVCEHFGDVEKLVVLLAY